MASPFNITGASIDGPALGMFAVTKHDTNPLASPIRQITIGGAGTISIIGWDGETYTSGTLPAGTYPCFATHIRSTGTTATDITGWI